MDRRAPALAALMLFAVATVLATVLDGRLPASEESVAGWILQVLGYLAALAGGVLLGTSTHPRSWRAAGFVVLGALVVMVLVDAVALSGDGGGADIGLGLVRVIALAAVSVVAVRLAVALAGERWAGPPATGR